MLKSGHPIEPEELMAYLDGELEVERSQVAAEHLERCTVCRETAEDFRRVSRAMSRWEVEEYEAAAPGGKMRRRWGWWWKGAVVVAMALVALSVSMNRLAPVAQLSGPIGVMSGNAAL